MPPPGNHVFQSTETIFELVQDITRANLLTKFHEDPTINVASTVKTKQIFMTHYGQQTMDKNDLEPHQKTSRIFNNNNNNVASRVLTRENAPPPGSHSLQGKMPRPPPPGGHVFQPTGTIVELVQYFIGTNLLTKFHDDRTINVASRVLTRKNAPPHGGHVFLPTGTNFQYFIGINLLTKVQEDRTINVVSSVLTRQMLTAHGARRTKGRSPKFTMSTVRVLM
ncbi:hypothetical protein DPMN_097090 [Dreissena polymorpha]|uniref:Uncharacterized protein n=1 Tax=Dreissena polymorpha TaxID=45954 RepID=A0A9D4LCB8_DREPO|nr:hypothetical protein DPMN_097090 [Dreissena polymorpha]